MPKITEHGGPSFDPMDAPDAQPSEEAYNDAMSRHGTPEFTGSDQRLVERYQELRKNGDKENKEVAQSPGTSSSQSDENNKQNNDKSGNADQKRAQETGNRSTGVTTVSSVGGSTRATKK